MQSSNRTTSRELSDEAVRVEAEALSAYVARGGLASLWFEGKAFLAADRAAILTSKANLEAEP